MFHLSNIRALYNDSNLYGHALTSVPSKLMKFANPEQLFFVPKCVYNLDCVVETSLTRYKIIYCTSDSYESKDITRYFYLEYLEIVTRFVIGVLLIGLAIMTVVPIGFMMKVIDKGVCKNALHET